MTAVGIPVALAMDVGAVTAGILTIASNRIGNYLRAKINKHEKIKSLAEDKLCSISDYISKALKDGVVSEEEYSMVLIEHKELNAKKDQIRMKTQNTTQEQKTA